MLVIKDIKPADRAYLGVQKLSPLSRIFKIAVECDQNEEFEFEIMGDDGKEIVESGKTYHLLACQYNRLSQTVPKIGDSFTLEGLQTSKKLHVLDSDMPILWERDDGTSWETMNDWKKRTIDAPRKPWL